MLTNPRLTASLPDITASPTDAGELKLIVVRPEKNKHEARERVYLSPEGGVEGDYWRSGCWLTLPDGGPDPRVQISLMNARVLKLIAGEEERMTLAGDNLIVDFDLSEGNIKPGQRLAVGPEALVEVTDVAHNGCGKFMARYGKEVVKFVNSAEGKQLHLRGLYARIVRAGEVSVGDEVRKELS